MPRDKARNDIGGHILKIQEELRGREEPASDASLLSKHRTALEFVVYKSIAILKSTHLLRC